MLKTKIFLFYGESISENILAVNFVSMAHLLNVFIALNEGAF